MPNRTAMLTESERVISSDSWAEFARIVERMCTIPDYSSIILDSLGSFEDFSRPKNINKRID